MKLSRILIALIFALSASHCFAEEEYMYDAASDGGGGGYESGDSGGGSYESADSGGGSDSADASSSDSSSDSSEVSKSESSGGGSSGKADTKGLSDRFGFGKSDAVGAGAAAASNLLCKIDNFKAGGILGAFATLGMDRMEASADGSQGFFDFSKGDAAQLGFNIALDRVVTSADTIYSGIRGIEAGPWGGPVAKMAMGGFMAYEAYKTYNDVPQETRDAFWASDPLSKYTTELTLLAKGYANFVQSNYDSIANFGGGGGSKKARKGDGF